MLAPCTATFPSPRAVTCSMVACTRRLDADFGCERHAISLQMMPGHCDVGADISKSRQPALPWTGIFKTMMVLVFMLFAHRGSADAKQLQAGHCRTARLRMAVFPCSQLVTCVHVNELLRYVHLQNASNVCTTPRQQGGICTLCQPPICPTVRTVLHRLPSCTGWPGRKAIGICPAAIEDRKCHGH